MEKLYVVKHELHGKVHTTFVNAVNEIDAIMEARTTIKDCCNVSHVVSVTKA